MTKKIGFFIADGFQALDLFGPLDAFMETNSFVSEAYSSCLIGLSDAPVKTCYGQTVSVDFDIYQLPKIDYLVICGGAGMRHLRLGPKQINALRSIADGAERVLSICTGAFVLTETFPEQGHRVTTHWRHCQQLSDQAVNYQVEEDPLFIESGKFWSSAGILSGVDLALEVIRRDQGNTIAASVAKDLVVYLQRRGGQSQYSDLLKVQYSDSLRLNPLLEWLAENYPKPISVSDMAERIAVSDRQLTRLFKQHLNSTPGHYLNQLRLNHARDLITCESQNLVQVARQVGFASYDSFRRAFQGQFGVSPSHFSRNQG
ncbi:helix-turn-helix domain-containing protein [Microbulbifer sp. OS29]|uniref:Helix-turn-helix domain-containing protein n=1 Tax=Microbulbifer okhotskensis TaxID=2926617 RepID=A0A9X2J7Z0_9GAMM|nr:helix-turn-helix domain-containing protein [Microbulbifer okhotskensis]MCO1336300.1 helix-turn-helix domain-containing protein [Microbulbifer okhotskensis]